MRGPALETRRGSQLGTLLRWRSRMVLGWMSSDLGLMSALLAGLVYFAVVALAGAQAWWTRGLIREVASRSPDLGLQLLGLSLLFAVGLQAGALYFFRVQMGGGLSSRAWVPAPVSPFLLGRLRTAEGLLNPGSVAAVVSVTLLTHGAWAPRSVAGLVVCALLGLSLATVTLGLVVLAGLVLDGAAPAVFWLVLTGAAATAAAAGAFLLDLVSSSTIRELMGLLSSTPAAVILRLPPWGIPILSVERLWAGRTAEGVLVALAGVALGMLLLRLGERRGARRDYG